MGVRVLAPVMDKDRNVNAIAHIVREYFPAVKSATLLRLFWAGMHHDSQKGQPNRTPSTVLGTPVDWQQWGEERPLRKPPLANSIN